MVVVVGGTLVATISGASADFLDEILKIFVLAHDIINALVRTLAILICVAIVLILVLIFQIVPII